MLSLFIPINLAKKYEIDLFTADIYKRNELIDLQTRVEQIPIVKHEDKIVETAKVVIKKILNLKILEKFQMKVGSQ